MRLSQQHLRYVRLLEMSAPELDEAVERELEDNPALEEVPGTRPLPSSPLPSTAGSLPFHSPLSSTPELPGRPEIVVGDSGESIYDHLRAQLRERSLDPMVREVAEYLIDSVDANGYLRRALPLLEEDMAFHHGLEVSHATAREALEVVRSLDPPGVGAADLRDALILQLHRLPRSQHRDDALQILDTQFEAFAMKHTHRIVSLLHISEVRVADAVALIRTLNPKPGAPFGGAAADTANVIVPDFVISYDPDGRLTLALNNSIPELRIESSFAEAVDSMNRARKERLANHGGNEFVAARFADARDFIRILSQRQQTMMAVMTAIMQIQSEYFATEDVYRLRPMMIKDITALTGLDISAVSRATASKFVSTPWGVFPLRFFFSDTIGAERDTETLTNRKAEAEIKRIVDAEDKRHPLSDEKIRQAMLERGYDIKRRTVAKYRDRVGIPVARLRVKM